MTSEAEDMLKLPHPFNAIPFHRLSYPTPSPIHTLSALTKQYRSTTDTTQLNLWAKREDQAGPLTCYGNKYRKFEYIIPDIVAQIPAVTTLVTEGAIQSNHTVQVAGLARRLGLKCTVLLHQGVGGMRAARDKEMYSSVGNVQLNRMLGATVAITDASDTGDEKGPLIPILDELRDKGETPYWISSGASLHVLGGLGYARCAFEIALQGERMSEGGELHGSGRFDVIFVACGSGSTFAGLIAGFKLLQKTEAEKGRVVVPPRVVGVMISPTKSRAYQEERILRLARNTGVLIGLQPGDFTEADVHLDDRFTGEAYGVLDRDTAGTIDRVARAEGMVLDPVYTAKVMRGMLYAADRGELMGRGGQQGVVNALFIHTGGQSALSAYSEG